MLGKQQRNLLAIGTKVIIFSNRNKFKSRSAPNVNKLPSIHLSHADGKKETHKTMMAVRFD